MEKTLTLTTKINCGEKTCDDCRWVYGDKVGDPYCGWFNAYAVSRPGDVSVGKYKDDRKTLKRLPECIDAEKVGEFNPIPPKEVLDAIGEEYEDNKEVVFGLTKKDIEDYVEKSEEDFKKHGGFDI